MENSDYRIGNFNEMVIFLRPEIRISETGASETVYVVDAQRLSEVKDHVESEANAYQAETIENVYTVFTYLVVGAGVEWKVEYNGERYNIVRVRTMKRGIIRYDIIREDLCNE